jgi:HK97 family phage portal protein
MSEVVWYDEAKVRQPGSPILTKWRQEREAIRNNVTSTNLTMEELSKLIGAGAMPGMPTVTEQTAMSVSAVYACVALIAGAIATLPLPVYRRTTDGRERADHDYWWLLNEAPNLDMCAAVFWEYLLTAYLLHGDAFCEIVRPSFSSSRVVALRAHHPRRVMPFREMGTNRLLYRIQPQWSGEQYTLDPADMLHITGLGFDGLRSCSPILHAARQTIGTALAAGDYSSAFFSNGARPDFALKVQGKLSADQLEILRKSWIAAHAGPGKSHTPAILSGGMEIEQLTMSNEDAQLLATRAFQIEEIARIFGVPPFMIGQTEKTSSWGSGVENMGRGFVKFTLQRHLIKFEQEINRKFWPNRERYFVEFTVAGLERGDLKSENDALRVALGRAGEPGWMTQNEVRRIKNLPPVEGGDELISGLTNTTGATNDTTSEATDSESSDPTQGTEPD